MEHSLNKTLIILLSISPVGLFIIKGWVGTIHFLAFAISIFLISSNYISKIKQDHNKIFFSPIKQFNSPQDRFWIRLVTAMLVFPILAVYISQLLRDTFFLPDFDGPSRFLLALPIFYIVINNKADLFKYWQLTIAFAISITFICIPWIPKYYGTNNELNNLRLGTYFVDPLTFGCLMLTFGLLLLFNLSLNKVKWPLTAFKLVSAALGIFLSLKSGSRTGWLALPFILPLLLWLYGPANKIKATFLSLLLTLFTLIALYGTSITVQHRIHEAVNDIKSYKIHSTNAETSLGERISFARMAWYYFKLNPLSGWGHDGFKTHYDDPEISVFADANTRHHPAEGGLFHNELTTNMVAFGIGGIIYTCLLFFVPLALFIHYWRNGKNAHLCAFGVAYVICELAGSLSTEVFALKFTASFYALFISCLCALVISNENQQPSV